MGVEIEWRFVVTRMGLLPPCPSVPILQAYLGYGSPVVRARVKGDRGFITIKAALEKKDAGPSPSRRLEFEYEIPLQDAKQIIALSPLRTQKTRHLLPGGIELDVFVGKHRGLVIAEYEIEGETAEPPAPPEGWKWIDISADARYLNRVLAEHGIPPDAPLIGEEELERVISHNTAPPEK